MSLSSLFSGSCNAGSSSSSLCIHLYRRRKYLIFFPKNEGCIINISSVNGDRPFCGAAYTSQTGSSEGTSVSVTMNGTVCRAHLNASTAAQDLISRFPLTLTYTQMAGFEEKLETLTANLIWGTAVTFMIRIQEVLPTGPHSRALCFIMEVLVHGTAFM